MREQGRSLGFGYRWTLLHRRLSAAALAVLIVELGSAPAKAQEIAYCDMAFFAQTAPLQVNLGSVVMGGERKTQGIRLTEDYPGLRAAAFHMAFIPFAPGSSFFVHFRMRISGTVNAPPNGAEGLVFSIQNHPGGDPLGVGTEGKGSHVFGAAGAGMGYEGITQSLAIEFDSDKDTDRQDPDGNHIAFLQGGTVNHTDTGTAMGKPLIGMPPGSTVMPFHPVLLNSATQPLEATAASYDTRDVWIDYECSAPKTCTLKVYMTWNKAALASELADVTKSGTLPAKPAAPVMVVENLLDVQDYLKTDKGFAGFTASTSATMDEHLVTYWVMSLTPFSDKNNNNLEDVCECDVVADACGRALPFCDTVSLPGFCRDCRKTAECKYPTPACDHIGAGGTGACVECVTTGDCKYPTPACDKTSEGGKGTCVECLSDVHCIYPKELYCNLATKECTGKCTNADMCSDDKWCDNPSAAPFGGDCVPDLANGEPIPTVAGNTPPLEGVCSPDASQVVCTSRVCDKADNLCGYAAGTGPCDASTAQAVCRSGVCGANGACGCTADSQCGDTASGKVCDRTGKATLNQCVDGCRAIAVDGNGSGNGCPAGLECTSSGEMIGECIEPPVVPQPHVDEGGGCAQCGVVGGGRTGHLAGFGMLAALAGHLVRRQRRNRP